MKKRLFQLAIIATTLLGTSNLFGQCANGVCSLGAQSYYQPRIVQRTPSNVVFGGFARQATNYSPCPVIVQNMGVYGCSNGYCGQCVEYQPFACEQVQFYAPCEPVETVAPCEQVETIPTCSCDDCDCACVQTNQPVATQQPTQQPTQICANGVCRLTPARTAVATARNVTANTLNALARLINARRGYVISEDAELTRQAQLHAQQMAAYGVVYHAQNCGYEICAQAESLNGLMSAWEGSPAHMRIMLGNFREMGVGYARDARGRVFGCARFR